MIPLSIADIRREPELQCRARGINGRTVLEYSEAMKAGTAFPAVIVFRDSKGVLWLADGWHRVAAAERAGLVEIAADVRDGDRKAALLHAAGANAEHGLRRTLADKRAAVQRLLAAYPKWSDRKIGEAANVDHKTVGAARKAIAVPESGEFPTQADGAEAATTPSPQADLTPIYVRVMQRHACEPAEHVRALIRALLQTHESLTPQQVVEYIELTVTEPEPAAAATVAPRRRLVQRVGDGVATEGGTR